jgi:hypothetical protein
MIDFPRSVKASPYFPEELGPGGKIKRGSDFAANCFWFFFPPSILG